VPIITLGVLQSLVQGHLNPWMLAYSWRAFLAAFPSLYCEMDVPETSASHFSNKNKKQTKKPLDDHVMSRYGVPLQCDCAASKARV